MCDPRTRHPDYSDDARLRAEPRLKGDDKIVDQESITIEEVLNADMRTQARIFGSFSYYIPFPSSLQ
jgi:hypothetical protein